MPVAPLVACALALVVRPHTDLRRVRCNTCGTSAPRAMRAGMLRLEAEDDDDATFARCMKMRVSELKAELELRSISIEGLFEKEELARKLAEARATGRADPSVIDEFNKQSAERAWDATQGVVDVGETPDVSGATASDGSLPGGMDAATVQAMMQNPEMMAVLRNPKMQEVMAKVMQGGPEAAAEFMSDPEVREMLQKVKGLTG